MPLPLVICVCQTVTKKVLKSSNTIPFHIWNHKFIYCETKLRISINVLLFRINRHQQQWFSSCWEDSSNGTPIWEWSYCENPWYWSTARQEAHQGNVLVLLEKHLSFSWNIYFIYLFIFHIYELSLGERTVIMTLYKVWLSATVVMHMI